MFLFQQVRSMQGGDCWLCLRRPADFPAVGFAFRAWAESLVLSRSTGVLDLGLVSHFVGCVAVALTLFLVLW
jgi:hypothetical protein